MVILYLFIIHVLPDESGAVYLTMLVCLDIGKNCSTNDVWPSTTVTAFAEVTWTLFGVLIGLWNRCKVRCKVCSKFRPGCANRSVIIRQMIISLCCAWLWIATAALITKAEPCKCKLRLHCHVRHLWEMAHATFDQLWTHHQNRILLFNSTFSFNSPVQLKMFSCF